MRLARHSGDKAPGSSPTLLAGRAAGGDGQGTVPRRGAWFRRLDPYLLLIVLLSLLPIAPMLQPGYQWHAHDARHSVYFLFEFDQGIADGILFPRWQPDFAFGYGYPFFNIYGLLTLVGGAIYSAYLFWRKRVLPNRVIGNILIAAGALLIGTASTLKMITFRRNWVT